ncbi:MAG: winged helix-turn-helix domain-containing protein [Aliidongia sp.]
MDEKTEQYAHRLGRLMIYPRQRLVTLDGVPVKISSTEYSLLLYFVEHPNCLLTKDEIIRGAWLKVSVSDSTLSTYVGRIRELLGLDSVRTVINRGYEFITPVETVWGKDAVPPVASPVPRIVKLPPRSASPMVGRDVELSGLENRLRDYRQVALVGPNGVGKTRLAVEVGRNVARKFLDGVVMVDLSSLTDANAVASALAQAHNLPLQAVGVPIEVIADAIADRHMMICFDNCEHIGPIVTDTVKVLKARVPGLTILVTSQHVLDGLLDDIYWLNGLAVPPDGVTDPAKLEEYGAVALFVQRARSGDQRFRYDASNAANIAEICRRLDGVPGPLEIAASFVNSWSVKELLAYLDDRLTLLNRDDGTSAKRHGSLLGMVERSYGFLDTAEQALFCRLGIFPGWFSAGEARDIAGNREAETLTRLNALVHKSLVTRQEEDGEARYRLLETLRLYANQQLAAKGERRMLVERHLDYFTALVTRDEEAWETLSDAQLRQIYAPHIDNLRAALNAALAEPELVPRGITLLGLSGRLWSILVLVPEGRSYFDRYLPLIGQDTPPADAARMLRFTGVLYRHTDRIRAAKLLKQSATIYRKSKDKLNLGAVLAMLGGEYIYLGRHEEAKKALDEAWKLLSGSNRIKSLQNVMNNCGNLALIRNDLAEAARCLDIAAHLAREMGDALRENINLLNLGELELRRGALDRAIECARTAARSLKSAGEVSFRAKALTNLAAYLTLRGDYAEARHHAVDDLPLVIQEGGPWRWIRIQVWGALAAAAGEIAPAAKVRGWVNAERAKAGEIIDPMQQALDDLVLKVLETHRQPEDIEIWTADGARWSAKYAVDFIMRRIITSSGQSNSASEQNLL